MDSLRFIVVCLATVLMVLPIQGLEGAHRSLQQRTSSTSSLSISIGGGASVVTGGHAQSSGSSRSSVTSTLRQTGSGNGVSIEGSTAASAVGKTKGGCPAGCDDVSPNSKFSCADQKRFGKCDQNWMVTGKFCSCTCGRCVKAQKSSGCKCGDKAPSRFWSCPQQKTFGKCTAPWMKEQGFCKCTCGFGC